MTKGDKLIIPNDVDGFVIEEMKERLGQGITVTIAFGGSSMMPLIDGSSDKVDLAPVAGELKSGNVYAFVFQGHCVVHRLMRLRGDKLVFRGDNCRRKEVVQREAVLAELVAVRHQDGEAERCDTGEWRRKSRRISLRRSLLNLPYALFGYEQRRWERWVYLVALLVLMWAPVGGLGIRMNNFVFGIRMDHLVHASVYLPFVFFIMDFRRGEARSLLPHWLSGLLFAVVTETVQLALPYRGFDPNDLVANMLGITFGWIVVVFWRRKRRKINGLNI